MPRRLKLLTFLTCSTLVLSAVVSGQDKPQGQDRSQAQEEAPAPEKPADANGPQKGTITVNGRAGEATVLKLDGHTFVDVESLVRVGNGTLTFKDGQISLDFSGPESSETGQASAKPPQEAAGHGFSRDFMNQSIENVSELRDWATTLATVVQEGRHLSDNAIAELRSHATTGLELAAAAATTDEDNQGLDLLRNQFDKVGTWSDRLLQESKNSDTAKYSVRPGTLREDPASQNIIACGRFLATMLAGGKFKDDISCH